MEPAGEPVGILSHSRIQLFAFARKALPDKALGLFALHPLSQLLATCRKFGYVTP